MRLIGLAAIAVGVVIVAAPVPSTAVRLLGVLFVALGVWIAVTPGPEPEDNFILDHADAVHDVLADARERLMAGPVSERIARHAEVILASKYHA